MKSVESRLRELVCQHLNVREEQVVDGADFVSDLGADSLDKVELIISIEEEFKEVVGSAIPEEVADGFRTFGDVVRYIQQRSAA